MTSGWSTGAIVGVVVGALAFVSIMLAVIYLACWRGRPGGRIQHKVTDKDLRAEERRQRRQERQQNLDRFLEKLKEYEFDCRDIEVCVDSEGNEIHLGTGGFGCVILGARNGVQPVAIKQMLHTDQKAKEDFLNEIKLLKHVSLDANVLQYYGATIKDDYLWLVTEYMEGGDLRQALSADSDNQLDWWNGGKHIALDIAKGLAFLHSRGVVHRDIKSHNILLTREGRAKIADCGMAQMIFEDAATHERRAKQNGTFAWAAPEMLVKESRCTEKVDIYSFGVCLWEIVTSQMPRRGMMFCPSADSCPAPVISLIHDCMKSNPEDRPSAKEICRRLAACEPHNGEFEGLLDSAEAGGRRSTVLPPGLHGRGQGWNGLTLPEPRRSLPVFRYDSPMSTGGHEARRSSGSPASLELVRQPRKGLDMTNSLEGLPPPLAPTAPGQQTPQQAEFPDEKVEIASRSPRFYRPQAVGSRKPWRNALDIQPGIREVEEGSESGGGGEEGDGAMLDTSDSLPQSNSAFSQLVARYSSKAGDTGWRRESEETNILSSMDADACHIPSLHNTVSLTGELSHQDSRSEMTTDEARGSEAWQHRTESSLDIYPMASRGSSVGLSFSMQATQPLPTTEELQRGCRLDLLEPVPGTVGESSSTSEDEIDELEHATIASVQGFAGSVTSSSPQVSQHELQLHLVPRQGSLGSVLDAEPEDNTSHHLEVPRVRPRSPQATRDDLPLPPGDASMSDVPPGGFDPHLHTSSGLQGLDRLGPTSAVYRTGSSIYHSMDTVENDSDFESTSSFGRESFCKTPQSERSLSLEGSAAGLVLHSGEVKPP